MKTATKQADTREVLEKLEKDTADKEIKKNDSPEQIRQAKRLSVLHAQYLQELEDPIFQKKCDRLKKQGVDSFNYWLDENGFSEEAHMTSEDTPNIYDKLQEAIMKQDFMIIAVGKMTGEGADIYSDDVWFGCHCIMHSIGQDMREVMEELEKK